MSTPGSIAFFAFITITAFSISGCNFADEKKTQIKDNTQEQSQKSDTQDTPTANDQMTNKTDDKSITAKIRTVLVNHPALAGLSIIVSVSDGAVTLTGNVDNQSQRETAFKLAQNVRGVNAVTNNIMVSDDSE